MKKLLLTLVLAAGAFYPLGEAEAASKQRGFIGVGVFDGTMLAYSIGVAIN